MSDETGHIYRLLHDALEHAERGEDRDAANTYAVAADAIDVFGSRLWARDIRNVARQHAVTAWVRSMWKRGRWGYDATDVTADDVYPYAFRDDRGRVVTLGDLYGASGAAGDVHRWRIQLPRSYTNFHVAIDRRGRIGWADPLGRR